MLAGDDDTLRGLVFQDANMKDYMHSFPEVLFVDATYKLLEIRLPIYLLLCEDSMGNSEVVSVGMLSVEDADTLTWMFQTLRSRNPEMDRVRVLITDKDLKERQVLRACFPDCCLLICLFHTLRTFRREITCEKMTISAGQRLLCIELLQKLAYSKSDVAYDGLYEQFKRDAPATVLKYYNDNWHGIRREWVRGFAFQVGNFMNFTNNRLECINSKLKSVISKFSSLEDFLEKLYVIIEAMRLERDSRAAKQFLKTASVSTPLSSSEMQYGQLLTPYAAQFVREQMRKSDNVVLQEIEAGEKYSVAVQDCFIEVTSSNCSCLFRKSMLLPCRHIFAVRKHLSFDVFSVVLCDRRWHADYFKANGRVFTAKTRCGGDPVTQANFAEAVTDLTVHTGKARPERTLSGPQKVKIGLQYGATLANLHADVGSKEFAERVDVYRKLEHLWQMGKRAFVGELINDQATIESRCPTSEEADQVDVG